MRKLRLFSEFIFILICSYFGYSFWNNFNSNLKNDSESVEVESSSYAYPGFTLIPGEGNERVDLVNMSGKIVHSWNLDSPRARLLKNGNLASLHGTKSGSRKGEWEKLKNSFKIYSWEGEEVLSHSTDDILHHDFQILPDDSFLLLKRTIVPDRFKEVIANPLKRTQDIRSDTIYKINKANEITWFWNAHEHLDLNSCGLKGCRVVTGEKNLHSLKDWTHINTAGLIPENKWYDDGDERFKPGNIITLARNWWTAFIIDKDSKEVVWEYTGDYKGGLSGGHESYMIPKGFPGAGNILIFDNGRKVHEGESFILEINPQTKEIIWIYEEKDFFSQARGSVQRLPNGNTLISEDLDGKCFEVNANKEVVWSYQSEVETNRCRRYSKDYTDFFKDLPLN